MDNMHVYLICYYNINNKSSLKTDNWLIIEFKDEGM